MREFPAATITATVKRLCQEANLVLGEDMLRAFDRSLKTERSPAGRQVLEMIIKSAEIVAYEDLATEAIRPADGRGLPRDRRERHARQRPLRGRDETVRPADRLVMTVRLP